MDRQLFVHGTTLIVDTYYGMKGTGGSVPNMKINDVLSVSPLDGDSKGFKRVKRKSCKFTNSARCFA